MKKLDKSVLRKLIVETIEKDLNEGKKKKGVKQELAGKTPVEADVSQVSANIPTSAGSGGSIDAFIANVKKAIEALGATPEGESLRDKMLSNVMSTIKDRVEQELGINKENPAADASTMMTPEE